MSRDLENGLLGVKHAGMVGMLSISWTGLKRMQFVLLLAVFANVDLLTQIRN